jgi:hypothetical protein
MVPVRRLSIAQITIATILLVSTLHAADVTVSGHVTDDNDARVADATITVRAAGAKEVWESRSGASGAWSLTLPQPGEYLLNATREGYYEIRDRPISLAGPQEINLVMDRVKQVFESLDVRDQPSPLDLSDTQNQSRLTGSEIDALPYPNSHSLRSSMKLMPDVVLDSGGAIHVNGAQENQVQYLLNGFDITNPISGQFQTMVAVEGIRSIDLATGRYSAEYGKGSAGALAVNTTSGTDVPRYTVTDFVPAISVQRGFRFGSWYPRAGISGPIRKGRAWFADTVSLEYLESVIKGLPAGEDTRSGVAGSNLLHLQVNVRPGNILYSDLLVNEDRQSRVGLGVLTPLSTTTTVRNREYFGSLKDQIFPGAGMMIELGYAHNHFGFRQTPMGDALLNISPYGSSGNYFVRSDQRTARDQVLARLALPASHALGLHQVEAGINVDHLSYDGSFQRTGYQVLGIDGTVLSKTTFLGAGVVTVPDVQQAAWVRDNWQIGKRLDISLGLRQDWDRALGGTLIAPRVGISWAPFRNRSTRISGGYAVTADAPPLSTLGRPMDQTAFMTHFAANGVPLTDPQPATFVRGPGNLELPRASNWTLGVDHEIRSRIFLSGKFLRRRGRDGLLYLNKLNPDAPLSALPLPGSAGPGIYQLTNLRRDNFDSLQLAFRQKFAGQHEWMLSWTHSRAVSNSLIDPNSPEPLQILPGFAPVPWDAPNRILAWTYVPLPWRNWSVAALSDIRSGFPFSIRDERGRIVGPVSSQRYPMNVDVYLSIEKIVTLREYRFAVRLGVNNLLNRANPTAVYNVTGTPQFLHFTGEEGQHLTVRIRFFGKTAVTR